MMNSEAKVINFQLSMFGEYSKIQSDTDLVINLLSALKDKHFMPRSLNSASVDVTTGNLTINNRLQLYSPNKSWTISFLDSRIDFSYSYNRNDINTWDVDSLINYGNSLVKNTFNALNTNSQGNRLAVNLKTIFKDMSDQTLDKIASKFIINPTESLSDPYTDWKVNFNSQEDLLISEDLKESCNRIMEIMKYRYIETSPSSPMKPIQHQTMLVSFDLNTLPQNSRPRFFKENLIIFANNVKDFLNETTNDIWRKANEN